MIETIYHSNYISPIFGFVNSIILILGTYRLGGIIIKIFQLDSIILSVSQTKYQKILIGSNFIILIVFPIILLAETNLQNILYFISYLIYFFGLIQLLFASKKINLHKIINFAKNKSIFDFLIILTFLCYFLISSSPVTSADSLDYHLYLGKGISDFGVVPMSLTHLHSNLFGSGESLIALGLLVGSEQYSSIIQFSGLISLFGLIKKNKKGISNNTIYILSAPVLIFFLSTLKPQFFHISSNAFVFALIFFSDLKNKFLLKKICLCLFILCISATAKFSFMLSLFILGLSILYKSLINKIFIKTLIICFFSFIFIIFPFLVWKASYYNKDILSLLLIPFPTEDFGLFRFKQYLINSGRGGNIFSVIIFPESISNITNSLGLGCLLYFVLFKKYKQNFFYILVILIFIILGFTIGQPSSRFFFEPYIWVILTFSFKAINFSKFKIFDYLIKAQFIVLFPAVVYGAFSLFPGVFTDSLRNQILSKNAFGYNLFQWGNKKFTEINYSGPVITLHRSISLLKNQPISMDFIYFTDIGDNKYKIYLDEIKNLNPKYILTETNNRYINYFKNCDLELIFKEENISGHVSRKPFTGGNKKAAEIYQINTGKLPACFTGVN